MTNGHREVSEKGESVDRDRFDTLAKLYAASASRRGALVGLLAAALFPPDPAAVVAGKRSRKRVKQNTAGATAAAPCYPGTKCTPGRGRNSSGCDFALSTLFRNLDVRGSNLSNSSFAGADLRGADFRGANLSGGCFAGADLTGARLGSSVNLSGAIFCNTTMPDGTIDNRGCEGETPCCHLRLQDCPNAKIECYTEGEDGCQQLHVGDLGPVGNCWSFLGGCCPCGHPDTAYWSDLCTQTFPEACGECRDCTGRCIALQADVFPKCVTISGRCF